MKVLLVDAFSKSAKGRTQFKQFYETTRQCFERASEGVQPNYVVRSFRNLKDYIYEADTEFMNPRAYRNFDSVDFIIVDGNANLRPWTRQVRQLLLLFKMAVMTQKCCFLASVGFQTLVHLFATSGVKLEILNGPVGGRTEDLSFTKPVVRDKNAVMSQPLPVFLDNKTGDLFFYRPNKKAWCACSNVGMRLESAAERKRKKNIFHNICVYRPQYQVHKEVDGPYMSKPTSETVCIIHMKYVQHFIFRNIRTHRFVIPQQNKWVVNESVNSLSFANYKLLADNSREPQIIEYQNILGIQPNIQNRSKYPEVAQMLENYINHLYTQMRHKDHIDSRITSTSWESFVNQFSRNRNKGKMKRPESKSMFNQIPKLNQKELTPSIDTIDDEDSFTLSGLSCSSSFVDAKERNVRRTQSATVRSTPTNRNSSNLHSGRINYKQKSNLSRRPESAMPRSSGFRSSLKAKDRLFKRRNSFSVGISKKQAVATSNNGIRKRSAAEEEKKRLAIQDRRNMLGDSFTMTPATIPKLVPSTIPSSPMRGSGMAAAKRRVKTASLVRPKVQGNRFTRRVNSARPRSRSTISIASNKEALKLNETLEEETNKKVVTNRSDVSKQFVDSTGSEPLSSNTNSQSNNFDSNNNDSKMKTKVKVNVQKRRTNQHDTHPKKQWMNKIENDRNKRAGKVKVVRTKKKVPFCAFAKHSRREKRDRLIPGYGNGCVVTASGPYMSYHDRKMHESKISKTKWIGTRNFTAVVGKATTNDIPWSGFVRCSGPYRDGVVQFRDFSGEKLKADPLKRRGWQ